jgi:hypothetical protein
MIPGLDFEAWITEPLILALASSPFSVGIHGYIGCSNFMSLFRGFLVPRGICNQRYDGQNDPGSDPNKSKHLSVSSCLSLVS